MRIYLVLFILVLLGLPATAHDGHEKAFANKDTMVATNQKVRISPEGQAAIGLKVAPVTAERLQTSLEITGIVEPADNKIHYVTSPVTGVISRLDVQQNDSVRKGQLLATVYSADVASVLADLLDQIGSIQAEITKIKAQARNDAEIQSRNVEHFTVDVEREKNLLAEGIASRKTYLDALHELDVAKARLDGTRQQVAQNVAALKTRQQNVTEATKRKLSIMGVPASQIDRTLQTGKVIAEIPIYAPASGIVFSREATNGESIDTTKKLISIVNLSPIWVSLNINQEQLGLIRLGQQVLIKPPTGAPITGKISSIAPVVDKADRTIHVRVGADNTAGVLRPQMFVTAAIVTGKQASSSITVPSQALIEDGGKYWIYVKYGDDFQAVAVRRGLQVGDRTQILDGLYEGDQVVVSGARQVRAQAMLASKTGVEQQHEHVEQPSQISQSSSFLLAAVLAGGIALGAVIALIAMRLSRRKEYVTEKEKVTTP